MMEGSILAMEDRMTLGNGMDLRLLSALEVLQARRETDALSGGERERALCSNACLLARALEVDGNPIFESGAAVLAGMRVEEISALAQRWAEFNRRENPSLNQCEEDVQTLKKN